MERRSPVWETPPENLILAEEEVHIWRVRLDLPTEELTELEKILSDDERERANRFYLAKHKHRFIAGRGNLRQLLGSYLDLKSDRLKFEYSDRGKPSLSNGANRLQFNVSHSENLALYGFTKQVKIGIDLEYLRLLADAEKIAQRFFAEREYHLISSLPKSNQQQVFFQIWTAKEAYLKATGEGLTDSLDGVEIGLDGNVVYLRSLKGMNRVTDWFVRDFVPDENYVAAIAVKISNNLTKDIKTKFYSLV